MKPKVLGYVVTYNAGELATRVLDRIPVECWNNDRYDFDVVISDDCSKDDTVAICECYAEEKKLPIRVTRTPHNLGYGGNQKRGYALAVKEGYDVVVLLHGDDQYDASYIPALSLPILEAQAEAVLGSRMLKKRDALKGGMPLYKWLGNQVLTRTQNFLLNSRLAEFHTGLRAYSVKALSAIPFGLNNDGYIFDTEILMQMMGMHHRILEVPIATRYGDEVCHVNGLKYARKIIQSTLLYRLHRAGLTYRKRFDLGYDRYPSKVDFDSSHRFALEECKGAKRVLMVGHSNPYVADTLRQSGVEVVCIGDAEPCPYTAQHFDRYVQADLTTLATAPRDLNPDVVLLLDIVDQCKEPDVFLTHLRNLVSPKTKIVLTVANVGVISMRLSLLFGFFNYTSRGTTDYHHLRFFTFASLKTLLRSQGFDIVKKQGIPAPFPQVFGRNRFSRGLLKLNRWAMLLHRGLFAYQIAFVVHSKALSHDS